ncbi:MAG: fumarylacetoacetase [Bryobacteraceae bacterium]|nr:fumarylacetoacetase [Bryobacteraceae bacterium]
MRSCWVQGADDPELGFGLDNLPWCRFNGGRLGVGIGEFVIEVDHYDRVWLESRLRADSMNRPRLIPLADVSFDLPFSIGDYTDFYASIHHATNVGRLFRPDNPLLPNYRHVPIAYHGRASSIVVSGTPVKRPRGQLGEGRFGPTEQLDYELELGAFIGTGNPLGSPIPASAAHQHIAGFCLVNDWSARDIQRWEYQPLGPFLGKSFATSVSPWVVVPEALAPYSVPAEARPETLAYLQSPGVLYDITLEVRLNGELMCRSNTRDLYWTFAQMIAHHTSNGCNLRPGDLLASGTVSGPEPTARGCLLEAEKPFLRDGDEVELRGYAESPGKPRISFGECRGRILPAG